MSLGHPRLQRGVSVVETLIVIGLLSVFMVVLTDMFASILDIQSETSATSGVSQDGRYILSRLNYDINRATSITTPAALGGSSTTLALQIGGVTNTYSVFANNLQLSNENGANMLNGSETSVSSFTVQRLGNVSGKDTLRITFTVTGDTATDQGAQSTTFTTTLGRR